MSKVFVTGATGFVGQALIAKLIDENHDVTAVVREHSLFLSKEVMQVSIGDLKEWSLKNSSFNNKMKQALLDIDVVIHLAARVHVMTDNSSDPLTEFRAVNTDATLSLAILANYACVKRFIFISSVKVNGENTSFEKPFTPDDKFVPDDPYGLSKYEAEQGLLDLAKETGMEVVIIRPPLVYGPGVRANFATMMKWVNKGVILPFGDINNRRSLIALDNLVSFIIHCIDHPKAANEIFLISDGEDVSTTELLRKVGNAYGNNSRLFPIPVGVLECLAKLLGKEDIANRLFSSLQVDNSKATKLLGWKQVISMDEQLRKIANDKLKEKDFI